MQTRLIQILTIVSLAATLSGCTNSQVRDGVRDVAFSGAGGVIASKISNGNPIAMVAGATGGYVLSKAFQADQNSQIEAAEKRGIEHGRAEAVQQQYWIIQNQQNPQSYSPERSPSLVPIEIPETRINGVIISKHIEYIHIDS